MELALSLIGCSCLYFVYSFLVFFFFFFYTFQREQISNRTKQNGTGWEMFVIFVIETSNWKSFHAIPGLTWNQTHMHRSTSISHQFQRVCKSNGDGRRATNDGHLVVGGNLICHSRVSEAIIFAMRNHIPKTIFKWIFWIYIM